MRARANDRALKNLGVREMNLGSLPEGAKIVNLPNQVRCGRAFIGLGQEMPVVLHDRPCMNPRSTPSLVCLVARRSLHRRMHTVPFWLARCDVETKPARPLNATNVWSV